MEKDGIEIKLGDAYELIKAIPDNSIDLIYTDAPYSLKSGGGGAFSDRPFVEQIKPMSNGFNLKLLNQFDRILKAINIYIWVSKEQIFEIMKHYENCNILILFWGKNNPIPRCNNNYLSDLEYCLYITEPGVYRNFKYNRASRYFISNINKADKEDFKHPTIKPLAFVKNHILNSCPPGGGCIRSFFRLWNNSGRLSRFRM